MIWIGNFRREQCVVISMRIALHDARVTFEKFVNRFRRLVYVKIENVVETLSTADGDIHVTLDDPIFFFRQPARRRRRVGVDAVRLQDFRLHQMDESFQLRGDLIAPSADGTLGHIMTCAVRMKRIASRIIGMKFSVSEISAPIGLSALPQCGQ